jgi:hypothetical protein
LAGLSRAVFVSSGKAKERSPDRSARLNGHRLTLDIRDGHGRKRLRPNYRPLFVIGESGLRKYADKPLIAEMPEQGGAPAAVARELVASASSRRRTKRGRRQLSPMRSDRSQLRCGAARGAFVGVCPSDFHLTKKWQCKSSLFDFASTV